jgi:hypothetical protein
MYIYSKTGYWNKELYRFGIVYIMKNGSLSPVFDIRGAYNLSEDVKCTEIAYKNNDKVNKIEYDEETYKLINVSNQNPNIMYENVKGVVRMNQSTDTKKVHYFKITTTNEVITELSKYVKGFFFVRQNRIPSILA